MDDFVFTTLTGKALSRDNTRTRILAKAVEFADESLVARDLAPLPERLTQHSLRHTYISLRVAIGDDLAAVSRDAGHADINVTFRIYTHVTSLRDGDRAALRSLVEFRGFRTNPDYERFCGLAKRRRAGPERRRALNGGL